jgi:hypothetical protein
LVPEKRATGFARQVEKERAAKEMMIDAGQMTATARADIGAQY